MFRNFTHSCLRCATFLYRARNIQFLLDSAYLDSVQWPHKAIIGFPFSFSALLLRWIAVMAKEHMHWCVWYVWRFRVHSSAPLVFVLIAYIMETLENFVFHEQEHDTSDGKRLLERRQRKILSFIMTTKKQARSAGIQINSYSNTTLWNQTSKPWKLTFGVHLWNNSPPCFVHLY